MKVPIRCNDCNGSGVVWNEKVTELVKCENCDGTGEIVTEIKTKTLRDAWKYLDDYQY
jgi:DnaJ-class molecular chaperone